jgi:hypothetical protein
MHVNRGDRMHPELGVYGVPLPRGNAEENGMPFGRELVQRRIRPQQFKSRFAGFTIGALWAARNNDNWNASCKQRKTVWVGIGERASIQEGLASIVEGVQPLLSYSLAGIWTGYMKADIEEEPRRWLICR